MFPNKKRQTWDLSQFNALPKPRLLLSVDQLVTSCLFINFFIKFHNKTYSNPSIVVCELRKWLSFSIIPGSFYILKLKLKLSLNLLKKTNLWNIKSSHSRSKNLTRWNVKISYTSLKRTILFPWKGFLYLSEKVTISAKCFIFKVFERALNTPQNFFYVLAKLNKAIVTATFQKYSAAKKNKVSNLKVLLCSNTGK